MADLPSYHTNLAAQVLEKHWGIKGEPTRSHVGVSRGTWRIGSIYWLSQAEHFRFAELSRQAKLQWDLHLYLREENFAFSVPEIVGSHTGGLVVVEAGYVWCLTCDLPDFHPEAGDPETYRVLTEGLARFHDVLRTFSSSESSRVPAGICVKTRHGIDRLGADTFVALTSDPQERDILQRAAAWLLPRLDGFEGLPRQIVHGDWTPQNVLFKRVDEEMRFTGVLDMEAMAKDPACVDVANTCCTLLMWSGLDKPEERIGSVVEIYERSAGASLKRNDIHIAMLARWFCHYWDWRDRLEFGEFGHEVKGRLCTRIASVLSYLADPGSLKK
jgi:Ser/Thr protein kinase RdoA (MazF antagonist)